METIFATAFGRNISLQKGESDCVAEAASGVFADAQEMKNTSPDIVILIISANNVTKVFVMLYFAASVVLAGNFPWLTRFLQYLVQGSKRELSFMLLCETASKLIQERRKEKNPRMVCSPIVVLKN